MCRSTSRRARLLRVARRAANSETTTRTTATPRMIAPVTTKAARVFSLSSSESPSGAMRAEDEAETPAPAEEISAAAVCFRFSPARTPASAPMTEPTTRV